MPAQEAPWGRGSPGADMVSVGWARRAGRAVPAPSVPGGSIRASSVLEPLRSHARDSHGAAEGLRRGFPLSSPSSEEWPFRLGTPSETKAGFSASPQKNISRLDDVEQS